MMQRFLAAPAWRGGPDTVDGVIEIPSDRGTIVVDYGDYGAPIAIDNPPC